jgi:hypothetical protein
MFLYLGVAIASHLLFNIQDVWGATCKETPAANLVRLQPGDTIELPQKFETKEFCHPTGVMLTGGARYVIKMVPSPWFDGGIPVRPGNSPWEAANWLQKLIFLVAVPLRRELFEDWFEVVVRYGRIGGEEAFYIYDPTDPNIEFPMKPTRDGELFVFVNDAVIGLPLLYDRFYRNNLGGATIRVTRTKTPAL